MEDKKLSSYQKLLKEVSDKNVEIRRIKDSVLSYIRHNINDTNTYSMCTLAELVGLRFCKIDNNHHGKIAIYNDAYYIGCDDVVLIDYKKGKDFLN